MRKLIFIWASILILLSPLSISPQTLSPDTSQIAEEIVKQKGQIDDLKMELEKVKEGYHAEAMENAKRSIDLANLMISILVLAVAVMAALGILSHFRTGEIRKKVEKGSEDIRKLKEEAETLMTNIKTIFEDVKRIGKDIEKAGREIDEKKQSVDKSKTEVSAISYYSEGNRFLSEKKYEEAIEKYRKTTELKPDYAEAYVNWGYALGELDRHEEEIEKYRKATELKPDFAEAYTNWSVALAQLGRYDEAIEKGKKAIALKPDYASAWYNIACGYSLQNKKKEALENLKKAIELDPSCKEKAKKDGDFKNLWEDEDFKKLVE